MTINTRLCTHAYVQYWVWYAVCMEFLEMGDAYVSTDIVGCWAGPHISCYDGMTSDARYVVAESLSRKGQGVVLNRSHLYRDLVHSQLEAITVVFHSLVFNISYVFTERKRLPVLANILERGVGTPVFNFCGKI